MSKHLETPERAKKWAEQMLLASLAIIPVGIACQLDVGTAAEGQQGCVCHLMDLRSGSSEVRIHENSPKGPEVENGPGGEPEPGVLVRGLGQREQGMERIAIQNKKMVAEFGVWEDGKSSGASLSLRQEDILIPPAGCGRKRSSKLSATRVVAAQAPQTNVALFSCAKTLARSQECFARGPTHIIIAPAEYRARLSRH